MSFWSTAIGQYALAFGEIFLGGEGLKIALPRVVKVFDHVSLKFILAGGKTAADDAEGLQQASEPFAGQVVPSCPGPMLHFAEQGQEILAEDVFRIFFEEEPGADVGEHLD